MSDETRHPERRAGQQWEYSDGIRRVVYVLTEKREDYWYGLNSNHRGAPMCFASEREFAELPDRYRLLADVPATPQPSAPVVDRAFHFCGLLCWAQGCKIGGIPSHPPLAAQPAEEKLDWYYKPRSYQQHSVECGRRCDAAAAAYKRTQPKPAKGHDFSDPYCARRYEGAVVRLCVACGAFDKDGMRSPGCELIDGWRKGFEGWVGETAQSGKPYTGPERIVKPPMAHIAGMHDDDLVGGAR